MIRILPLLLVLCLGCSSVTPPKSLKNVFKDNRPKTPGRMVAFWQCYTQTNPGGGEPLRGVGGRIQFYNEKNAKDPVKVDGELAIYLFDAHDPVPQRSIPIKHAIFKKESLPAFYRKDNFEMNGYDFFVPVDEIGNEEMDLQVLAVFHETKKAGKTAALIYSNPAVVTLTGPKREEIVKSDESSGVIDLDRGREESSGEIMQASYRSHSSRTEPELRKRKSETIQLSERFTQAYQNDRWTEEKFRDAPRESSPSARYGSIDVTPSSNETEIKVVADAETETRSSWLKTPSRFKDISQRGTTSPNNRPFRVDSNTRQRPEDQPIYEEVSASGVQSRVFMGK